MTAECLEILSSELKPLKEAEAEGGLLPQVLPPTLTHSVPCTPQLQTQWQPACLSMLMLAAAVSIRKGCSVLNLFIACCHFNIQGYALDERARVASTYSC